MKYIFWILIALGAYQWYGSYGPTSGGSASPSHDELIMYSLTTCGYCKQKGRELSAAGIPYTEYFIDKDRASRDELSQKLENAGYRPQNYGTPIFDAYGTMLPNNPSLAKIRAAKDGG